MAYARLQAPLATRTLCYLPPAAHAGLHELGVESKEPEFMTELSAAIARGDGVLAALLADGTVLISPALISPPRSALAREGLPLVACSKEHSKNLLITWSQQATTGDLAGVPVVSQTLKHLTPGPVAMARGASSIDLTFHMAAVESHPGGGIAPPSIPEQWTTDDGQLLAFDALLDISLELKVFPVATESKGFEVALNVLGVKRTILPGRVHSLCPGQFVYGAELENAGVGPFADAHVLVQLVSGAVHSYRFYQQSDAAGAVEGAPPREEEAGGDSDGEGDDVSSAAGGRSSTGSIDDEAADGATAEAQGAAGWNSVPLCTLPVPCPTMVVMPGAAGRKNNVDTSVKLASVLLAHSPATSRLYANGQILSPAAGSIAIDAPHGYLMYITLGPIPALTFASIHTLHAFLADQQQGGEASGQEWNKLSVEYLSHDAKSQRLLEWGSRLVASVSSKDNVFLQLPRGNLEGVHPRPLVLESLRQLLDSRQYGEALAVARKQRIDMNFLVDHDPVAISEHFTAAIQQVWALRQCSLHACIIVFFLLSVIGPSV